jgi:hypothetical protein
VGLACGAASAGGLDLGGGGGLKTGLGVAYCCAGGGTMISGGGKYWPKAGNGAPKATNASPAANRTALVFMDAFLIAYFASPAVRGSRFPV